MPRRVFVVDWDNPDDDNWMNRYNLKLALSEVCTNTRFQITDITDPENPLSSEEQPSLNDR